MTVAQFGTELEDYFGGVYTPAQMREVKRWAQKRSDASRRLVYEWIVATEDTRYKTPPTVATLNKALSTVFDGYPELRGESYNKQIATDATQITDDAGWTEEELEANLAKLREIVGTTADARRMD